MPQKEGSLEDDLAPVVQRLDSAIQRLNNWGQRINFSLRWTLYKHRLYCLSFNARFVVFLFSQADLLTKMESLVQTFNAIKSLQMSKQNGHVSSDKSQIFSTWTIEQFCEYFLSHY